MEYSGILNRQASQVSSTSLPSESGRGSSPISKRRGLPSPRSPPARKVGGINVADLDLRPERTVQRLAMRLNALGTTPLMLHAAKSKPPPIIFKEVFHQDSTLTGLTDLGLGPPLGGASAKDRFRFVERTEARERANEEMGEERRQEIAALIERMKGSIQDKKNRELQELKDEDKRDELSDHDNSRGALLAKRLMGIAENSEIVLDRTLEVKYIINAPKAQAVSPTRASVMSVRPRGGFRSAGVTRTGGGLARLSSQVESSHRRLDQIDEDEPEAMGIDGRRLVLHKSEENDAQIEEMTMKIVYGLLFKVENLRGMFVNISEYPEQRKLKRQFRNAMIKIAEALRSVDGAVFNRLLVAQSRLLIQIQQLFNDEDAAELAALAHTKDKEKAGHDDDDSSVDTCVPRQFTRIAYAPTEEEKLIEQQRIAQMANSKRARKSIVNQEDVIQSLLKATSHVDADRSRSPIGPRDSAGAPASAVAGGPSFETPRQQNKMGAAGAAGASPNAAATRSPLQKAASLRPSDDANSALRGVSADRLRRGSAPYAPPTPTQGLASMPSARALAASGTEFSFSFNNAAASRVREEADLVPDEFGPPGRPLSDIWSESGTEDYTDNCSVFSEKSASLSASTASKHSTEIKREREHEQLPPPSTSARRNSAVVQSFMSTPLSHRPDVLTPRSTTKPQPPNKILSPNRAGRASANSGAPWQPPPGQGQGQAQHPPSEPSDDQREAQAMMAAFLALQERRDQRSAEARSGSSFRFSFPGHNLGLEVVIPPPLQDEDDALPAFPGEAGRTSAGRALSPSRRGPLHSSRIREEEEDRVESESDVASIDFNKIKRQQMKVGPRIRTAEAQSTAALVGRPPPPPAALRGSNVRLKEVRRADSTLRKAMAVVTPMATRRATQSASGGTGDERGARGGPRTAPLRSGVSRGTWGAEPLDRAALPSAYGFPDDRLVAAPIMTGASVRERAVWASFPKKRLPGGPRQVSTRIRDRDIDKDTPFVDPVLMQALLKQRPDTKLHEAIAEYVNEAAAARAASPRAVLQSRLSNTQPQPDVPFTHSRGQTQLLNFGGPDGTGVGVNIISYKPRDEELREAGLREGAGAHYQSPRASGGSPVPDASPGSKPSAGQRSPLSSPGNVAAKFNVQGTRGPLKRSVSAKEYRNVTVNPFYASSHYNWS